MLTTVILFFGFLVMLFSIHPPSVTISTADQPDPLQRPDQRPDMILLLIRWMMKEEESAQ